jgi:hypothetical protein
MLYPGKTVLPPGKSPSSRARILVHAPPRRLAERRTRPEERVLDARAADHLVVHARGLQRTADLLPLPSVDQHAHMIRGPVDGRQLPSGATALITRDFPSLPVPQQRATASRPAADAVAHLAR